MAFVSRYVDDQTRPSVGAALGDMARRAVLPAVGLWCLIVAGGFLVKGPLGDLPGEGVGGRKTDQGGQDRDDGGQQDACRQGRHDIRPAKGFSPVRELSLIHI